MFSGYPDKENACIGKPVIKGSDVIRVRKNLAMPFRQRNSMDTNPLAPSLFMRSSVNSPVTELANNFTELAAWVFLSSFCPIPFAESCNFVDWLSTGITPCSAVSLHNNYLFDHCACHALIPSLYSHENTPKRRLSMASSSGSPTPDLDRIKSVLNMSSESTSSSNSGLSFKRWSLSKPKWLFTSFSHNLDTIR